MNIKFIDETKTTLTDFCKNTVEKRLLSKLNIFEEEIEDIIVKLSGDSRKKFYVKLIVNPSTHSNKFIAMSSDKDLFEAIDSARNKIYSQISKLKKRVDEKRNSSKLDFNNKNILITAEEDNFDVVKIKEFDVKPMFLEEAITQMNALNHDFFIYLDAETEKVNVIYRRKQGNYGLIETTVTNT